MRCIADGRCAFHGLQCSLLQASVTPARAAFYTLETARLLMRFSSSRMLPWLADSICRMVSSSRLSSAFIRALFTIRLDFISDKSGLSCITLKGAFETSHHHQPCSQVIQQIGVSHTCCLTSRVVQHTLHSACVTCSCLSLSVGISACNLDA